MWGKRRGQKGKNYINLGEKRQPITATYQLKLVQIHFPVCYQLLLLAFCRFLSQKQRIVEAGKDLCRFLSPTPLLKARSARVDCSWTCSLGFVYLQGWRFNHPIFQFQYAIILSVRKVFMFTYMEFPVPVLHLAFCVLTGYNS